MLLKKCTSVREAQHTHSHTHTHTHTFSPLLIILPLSIPLPAITVYHFIPPSKLLRDDRYREKSEMRNSHCHLIAWPNRSCNRFLLSDIQSHWQRYQTDKSEHRVRAYVCVCVCVCVCMCVCGPFSLQHGRLWTARHLRDCSEAREKRQIEVLQYSLKTVLLEMSWNVDAVLNKKTKKEWMWDEKMWKFPRKTCTGHHVGMEYKARAVQMHVQVGSICRC